MNKKLLKASIAGAAAVALVTGGTTLAQWSDQWSPDSPSTITAGSLNLRVGDDTEPPAEAIVDFGQQVLVPGQTVDAWYAPMTNAGVGATGKFMAKLDQVTNQSDAALLAAAKALAVVFKPTDGKCPNLSAVTYRYPDFDSNPGAALYEQLTDVSSGPVSASPVTTLGQLANGSWIDFSRVLRGPSSEGDPTAAANILRPAQRNCFAVVTWLPKGSQDDNGVNGAASSKEGIRTTQLKLTVRLEQYFQSTPSAPEVAPSNAAYYMQSPPVSLPPAVATTSGG